MVANNNNLTVMEFWQLVGKAEAERVAILAGTTYEHFKHLAHGRRKPSTKLAIKLVRASEQKMSLNRLLFSDADLASI